MRFGMSTEQFEVLDQLVIRPLKAQGATVFIFGSRATGRHHPYSDVDLLYKADSNLPSGFISSLKEKIEESSFPFAVDLVNSSELAQSYRQSVEGQLIEL